MTLTPFPADIFKYIAKVHAQYAELERVKKKNDDSLARKWATLKGWKKRTDNKLLKRK